MRTENDPTYTNELKTKRRVQRTYSLPSVLLASSFRQLSPRGGVVFTRRVFLVDFVIIAILFQFG